MSIIINPTNSIELIAALREARPGDVIQLLPQKYIGQFTLAASPPVPILNPNDPNAPPKAITLQGTKSEEFQRFTTIVSRQHPHTALTITGGKWIVTGLVVRSKYKWDFHQVGVSIVGDGHVLNDLVFNCNRFGIRINGDNNRIESIRVSNSKVGIKINGSGNSVKDTVLSRILHDGIIVEAGSVGTNIQTTSVHMRKNPPQKNIFQRFLDVARTLHFHVPNEGRSLSLMDGSHQTTLGSSIFHGVANIQGVIGEISICKFAKLNLLGDQNNFVGTTIGTLYQNGALEFITFDDNCELGTPSDKILTFA